MDATLLIRLTRIEYGTYRNPGINPCQSKAPEPINPRIPTSVICGIAPYVDLRITSRKTVPCGLTTNRSSEDLSPEGFELRDKGSICQSIQGVKAYSLMLILLTNLRILSREPAVLVPSVNPAYRPLWLSRITLATRDRFY